MTATQQWQSDAQKGGYFPYILPYAVQEKTLEQQLLDPIAWNAVAKTRQHKYPRDMMLSFMTKIADGLTIEEALKTLV